ncbi:hypothetical protein OIV83_002963 [Microbotryomycetes sp. JL201]|nr:hypothetical protein OIV83_002963 [Microbotryomycetes sp. JL201]
MSDKPVWSDLKQKRNSRATSSHAAIASMSALPAEPSRSGVIDAAEAALRNEQISRSQQLAEFKRPILSTRPTAVLNDTEVGQRCNYCFRSGEELAEEATSAAVISGGRTTLENFVRSTSLEMEPAKALERCTACKAMRYCGNRHQKQDWPVHKYECKAIQEYMRQRKDPLSRELPPAYSRLAARVLWSRSLNEGEAFWQEFQSLNTNASQLQEWQQTTYYRTSMQLAAFVGESTLRKSASSGKDMLDLCSRTHSNAHQLGNLRQDDIGVALSPTAAIFNHDCSPNAAVVYHSSSDGDNFLRIMALRDIRAGEEVCLSYIDNTWPRWKRQAVLLKQYQFESAANVRVSDIWAGPSTPETPTEVDARCASGHDFQIDTVKARTACGLAERLLENEQSLWAEDTQSRDRKLLTSRLREQLALGASANFKQATSTYPLSGVMSSWTSTRSDVAEFQEALVLSDMLVTAFEPILGASHGLVAQKAAFHHELGLSLLMAEGSDPRKFDREQWSKLFASAARALEYTERAYGRDSFIWQSAHRKFANICFIAGATRSSGPGDQDVLWLGERMCKDLGHTASLLR